LANRIDLKQLGVAGHSQGGCVSAQLGSHADVRVVVSLSGAASTNDGPALESVLYLSGMDDRVMGYSFPSVGITVCPLGSLTVLDGYDFSPGPPKVKKRVVGITGGGHLVPTDLCQKNSNGKNGMEEAVAGMVCGVDSAVIIGLPFLFDCGNLKDYKVGVAATNYASTAALEETLHCKDRRQAFQEIKTKQPVVGELKEAL
jgi:predicted dienelactone hydrolase